MKNISQQNRQAINIANSINKINGLFFITDLNQNFTVVNKTLVNWSGYSDDEQILGVSYDKMRCKATEYADTFSRQDVDVIAHQESLKMFGGFYYTKNLWRLLLGEKCPIHDDKNQSIGIVGHFIDVTNFKFINLSSALKQLDRRFQIKNNCQFNYTINEKYHYFNISEREAECLFYFIRGKSYKEISNILSVSPRTVEKHISNVKLKTKCNSTSLIIEECINNGFINTIPKSIFDKALPF